MIFRVISICLDLIEIKKKQKNKNQKYIKKHKFLIGNKKVKNL